MNKFETSHVAVFVNHSVISENINKTSVFLIRERIFSLKNKIDFFHFQGRCLRVMSSVVKMDVVPSMNFFKVVGPTL